MALKQFREEVAPRVDVAVDVSRSMALTPAKERRTRELVCLLELLAHRAGARFRLFLTRPSGAAWPTGDDSWGFDGSAESSGLPTLPWDRHGLRIWISDLLWEADPELTLRSLILPQGGSLVLVPYAREETTLPPPGEVEWEDVETAGRLRDGITPVIRSAYETAYVRHFATWRETARRHGVRFARVAAELDLVNALRAEAVPMDVLDVG